MTRTPIDNSQCVVITPFSNRIEPTVELGLRELERRGYVVWREHGFSAIDLARSLLATRALDKSFLETLWIDSDVEFRPDDIDLMRNLTWQDLRVSVRDAPKVSMAIDSLEKSHSMPGVVCGLYVKKNASGFAANRPPRSKTVIFGNGGGPILVTYAGTGMMLVRSWVYESIERSHGLPICKAGKDRRLIPYFLPMVVKDHTGVATYLCEDYAFCERVQAAGIPIFADSRVRLYHLGSYGFSWEDITYQIIRGDSIEIEIDHPFP